MESKENVSTCPSCHSSSGLPRLQRTKPDGHTCPKDKRRNWADYSLEGTFIMGDLAAFKKESYYQSSPVRIPLSLSKAQTRGNCFRNECSQCSFPASPLSEAQMKVLSDACLPVLLPSEPHPRFHGGPSGSLGVYENDIFFCSRKRGS